MTKRGRTHKIPSTRLGGIGWVLLAFKIYGLKSEVLLKLSLLCSITLNFFRFYFLDTLKKLGINVALHTQCKQLEHPDFFETKKKFSLH